MNPLTAIPEGVRRWLYVVYAVLGPVLLWTKAHGWTGQTEIDLWVGLGTALGLTAAANVVPQVTIAAESGEAVHVTTETPPIVSSEGVRFDSFGAPYDAKHDAP